jgi:hypothetical protein
LVADELASGQSVETAKIAMTRRATWFKITVAMRTNGDLVNAETKKLFNPELLDEEGLRLADDADNADEFDEHPPKHKGKVWHSFQTC